MDGQLEGYLDTDHYCTQTHVLRSALYWTRIPQHVHVIPDHGTTLDL